MRTLMTLCKYVTIRNITDREQYLHDRQLPNGVIRLAPFEEATIPSPVYSRTCRTRWFIVVGRDGVSTEPAPEPEPTPIPESAREPAKPPVRTKPAKPKAAKENTR